MQCEALRTVSTAIPRAQHVAHPTTLLLSDPRKAIADVAEEVGYSDVKHFSKLFTRSTGLHPSKFRKLYY